MSFKLQVDALAFPPKLFFAPTLKNYADLLTGRYPASFVDSVVVALGTTVLALAIGAPAAYALSRIGKHRGVEALGLWILSVRMAPPLAFAIPLFLLYRSTGLLDTRQGLILVDLTFCLPLVIWLARSFFDLVPRALEEAAYIDGAGHFEAFRRVALPLAAPGLASTGILSFLFAWNDFFFALVLTRREVMTLPVAIVNFMNFEGWEWGRITAGASLIMLPVVVLAMAAQRYVVSGLAAGALRD
jgi:multiple sugar transport system permease protein